MKWILVWWIINPGHSQKMHLEHFDTESDCTFYATHMEAPPNKIIRWHCSAE